MQTQVPQSLFTALTSDEAAKTQGGQCFYYVPRYTCFRPVAYFQPYSGNSSSPSVNQTVNISIDD